MAFRKKMMRNCRMGLRQWQPELAFITYIYTEFYMIFALLIRKNGRGWGKYCESNFSNSFVNREPVLILIKKQISYKKKSARRRAEAFNSLFPETLRTFWWSPFHFITARCYASAVLAMGPCTSVCVCLCLSVSVSVTSRCSTKTAKRRITQTTPHDTPGILVF